MLANMLLPMWFFVILCGLAAVFCLVQFHFGRQYLEFQGYRPKVLVFVTYWKLVEAPMYALLSYRLAIYARAVGEIVRRRSRRWEPMLAAQAWLWNYGAIMAVIILSAIIGSMLFTLYTALGRPSRLSL